jgi:hypothetical protein
MYCMSCEIIFLSSSFWVFLYCVAVFSTGLLNNLHVNSQPPKAMSPKPKIISHPLKAKLWTLQLQVTLCILHIETNYLFMAVVFFCFFINIKHCFFYNRLRKKIVTNFFGSLSTYT